MGVKDRFFLKYELYCSLAIVLGVAVAAAAPRELMPEMVLSAITVVGME